MGAGSRWTEARRGPGPGSCYIEPMAEHNCVRDAMSGVAEAPVLPVLELVPLEPVVVLAVGVVSDLIESGRLMQLRPAGSGLQAVSTSHRLSFAGLSRAAVLPRTIRETCAFCYRLVGAAFATDASAARRILAKLMAMWARLMWPAAAGSRCSTASVMSATSRWKMMNSSTRSSS